MDMGSEAETRLLAKIEERGWRGRLVAAGRLDALVNSIDDRHREGLLDDVLYGDALSAFDKNPPKDIENPRSIIIVAVPTPPMRLTFRPEGRSVPVIIPPTYVSYTARTQETRNVLAAWLREDGWSQAGAHLPLKTLAVRSGLARYGRNNICYVPGMGSFLQLVGTFSDLPCDQDSWQDPLPLDRCDSCTACRQHCPTGAIDAERFLLHAERCLTWHNERDAEMPDWIDPSFHHCLVGCMRCQQVCAENRDVRDWVEDRGAFSEEETALLLAGTPREQLPQATQDKIAALQINELYRLLCRNLALALKRPRGRFPQATGGCS
jgi:epoxyqueuosine reductase